RELEQRDPTGREDAVRRFRSVWGTRGPAFAALHRGQKEQLAELCQATHLRALLEEARDVDALLFEQTGEPDYLCRKAWVCHQGRDEGDDAREALDRCLGLFREQGREHEPESARAARILAGILFDSGDDEGRALPLLEGYCLPVFRELSLPLEEA